MSLLELKTSLTPFSWKYELARPGNEGGKYISLDGCEAGPFYFSDVVDIPYQGSDDGDNDDGFCCAVFELVDGRFVAFETSWGPTGDGFSADAYGGDADLVFSRDLRQLLNLALTDAGRRLAGVPEELWNT